VYCASRNGLRHLDLCPPVKGYSINAHFTTKYPSGWASLGRSKHKWEGIIKMNLMQTGCENADWNCNAQDRNYWLALVNTVMNDRGSIKGRVARLPESWDSVSEPRMTVLASASSNLPDRLGERLLLETATFTNIGNSTIRCMSTDFSDTKGQLFDLTLSTKFICF
jgi:hypothetical protein